jgi:hypothetical protein
MGSGITPNGSETCWFQHLSVDIASFPEKRDQQEFSVASGDDSGGTVV